VRRRRENKQTARCFTLRGSAGIHGIETRMRRYGGHSFLHWIQRLLRYLLASTLSLVLVVLPSAGHTPILPVPGHGRLRLASAALPRCQIASECYIWGPKAWMLQARCTERNLWHHAVLRGGVGESSGSSEVIELVRESEDAVRLDPSPCFLRRCVPSRKQSGNQRCFQ